MIYNQFMKREEVISYIRDKYKVNPEYLWAKYPEYAVFRRSDNDKWFSIMNIKRSILGLEGDEMIEIIDVKCDPESVYFFCDIYSFYSAYHINKQHWITIALDSSLTDQQIQEFIDISYELTSK